MFMLSSGARFWRQPSFTLRTTGARERTTFAYNLHKCTCHVWRNSDKHINGIGSKMSQSKTPLSLKTDYAHVKAFLMSTLPSFPVPPASFLHPLIDFSE